MGTRRLYYSFNGSPFLKVRTVLVLFLVCFVVGIVSRHATWQVVYTAVITDGSQWRKVWIDFRTVRGSVQSSVEGIDKDGSLNAIESSCEHHHRRKSIYLLIVLMRIR